MSGDYEFSRAFVAAYERMPLWWRDQFDACTRDFVEALNRLAAWVEEHPDEMAILTADRGTSQADRGEV